MRGRERNDAVDRQGERDRVGDGERRDLHEDGLEADREQKDPEDEEDVVGALGEDVREAELEIRPDDLASRHGQHVRTERVGLALGGSFEPLARGLGVAFGADRQHVGARSAGILERERLRAGRHVTRQAQRELRGVRHGRGSAGRQHQHNLARADRFPVEGDTRAVDRAGDERADLAVAARASGSRSARRAARRASFRTPAEGAGGPRRRRRRSRRPSRSGRRRGSSRARGRRPEPGRPAREPRSDEGEEEAASAYRRRGRRRPSGRSGSSRSPRGARRARHPRGLRNPRAFRSRETPFPSPRRRRTRRSRV